MLSNTVSVLLGVCLVISAALAADTPAPVATLSAAAPAAAPAPLAAAPTAVLAPVAAAVAPAVYIENNEGYLKLRVLRKPGNCRDHKDWPNTMQCADTDRCISFGQFNNSKFDCCGDDDPKCTDKSDENRVAPGATGTMCRDHPHHKFGLVYQCATKPNICLSRLLHWNNGQCDCCPEQNFACGHPNCTDHSDEECPANEWKDKFSCDGNCLALSKLSDTDTDCFSDCTIEENSGARSGCEKKRADTTVKAVDDFCGMMAQKNTPYFRCTSGDKQCIPATCVRDQKKDCANGEDENQTINPDCSATIKASKCDANSTQCVSLNMKTDNVDCRCPGTGGMMENCNKDRPNRRRRLF